MICGAFLGSFLRYRKSAVIGIVSQFINGWLKIHFLRGQSGGDTLINQVIDQFALGHALIEQLQKGAIGCHLFLPGIAPGFMIQIQTFSGIDHLVSYQFS